MRKRIVFLRLPRLALPRMLAIPLLLVFRLSWLAEILRVRQFVFPQTSEGTNCLQMADALRALLVYRRDAVDAGTLPLRYGKSLSGGKVN